MRLWIISAAILVCSSFALAATAPAPVPAPIDAASDTPTKVLVAPFTEVNDQQQPDWISRAIQQAVADDLSSLGSVEVVPNPAAGTAAALPSTAQAKGAGIKYIIRASIQRLNGDIRVTGRVQNLDDGKTVGGFKATGPQTALFAIEDSITQQVKSVIAPMEGDLQDARPVGVTGGARTTTGTTPAAAAAGRGVFEGSDLQRALDDRDYLRRAQQRVPDYLDPNYYPPQQVYYPPTYPGYGYGGGYGYGYGGGWNSCGWGWGGFNGGQVIIVDNGGRNGRNHGGGGGSGGGGGFTSSVPITTVQTRALRNAAVNPGQSGNFIGPTPARAPVTSFNRTIPK